MIESLFLISLCIYILPFLDSKHQLISKDIIFIFFGDIMLFALKYCPYDIILFNHIFVCMRDLSLHSDAILEMTIS